VERKSKLPNPASLQRHDPDKVSDFLPLGPNPMPADGPMVQAVVARGRCLHIPTGRTNIVGTRPVEVNGTTVYRDVAAQEVRIFQQGATVELPQSEVDRLTELGFLIADVKPVKANGKAKPATGIANDPRL
jgi:hypothetical protein